MYAYLLKTLLVKKGLILIILNVSKIKIYKFSRLGEIILCGDFNARIGILDDYIYDLFLDHEINSAIPIDKRCSRDLQGNSYGRSLLELCIGNNSASVVDYVIGSHDLQSSINNFPIGNIIINIILPSLLFMICDESKYLWPFGG